MTSRSVGVDVERVLVPDRLRRVAVVDGVGVDARARARSSDAPCLPNRRMTTSGGSAARSPMVRTPKSASATPVFSPTPHSRPIGERRQERRLVAGRDDDQPVGLAQVRGDLRDELGGRDADRRGQPDVGADLVLDPARDRRAVPEQVERAR